MYQLHSNYLDELRENIEMGSDHSIVADKILPIRGEYKCF